ncbi:MAG TPA: DUF2155 domain-containing protein [Caulobacteraceae bacterium]|jgi:hypothetical protein|nr:DUF2155 domain-containing protein [Caulobacteraceae bacterium]
MKLPHWKLGLAVAAVMLLASGGLVLAQEKPPITPPAPPGPAIEEPPQEPAPKDVAPPPSDKGPAIVAPATNAAPPIKAPDSDDNDDDDNNDKSKSDDKDKVADGSAPVPETPGVRTRHSAAIIQALDKVTAETMRFEVPVGKAIRYKDLVFTVRSCETSAPEELVQDSIAYLQVRAEPKVQSGEETSHQVFSGWMFASSPGLDALQHPVYDAWLIACKA